MQAVESIIDVIGRLDEILAAKKDGTPKDPDSFYYAPPHDISLEILSHDPGSVASYECQMRLIFEPIWGKAHSVAIEGHDTPPLPAARAFPFHLAPRDVGAWTMAYGYLLSCLDLPAGARVLEIGFGAGGLSELMARSRLDVTAVEVRESNCQTLRQRAALFGDHVSALCGDAMTLDIPGQFDAVVFFESFHHMTKPRALLERLSAMLKPDGVFVFGCEPIQEPSPLIPFPWGFRMNGGSLCALREAGWVEFGFHRSFFETMLSTLGFSVRQCQIEGQIYCNNLIAQRL